MKQKCCIAPPAKYYNFIISISELPEVFQISGVKGGTFYISQDFLNKIDFIAIVLLNIFLLTIVIRSLQRQP